MPNGSANGWEKIDHLQAIRVAFEPPHACPQVLCGDFNTPQAERDGEIITFGQSRNGELRRTPPTPAASTAERPWEPELWDQGERAVLEGLPRDCGMPDSFRAYAGTLNEVTWVPRNLPEERGRRLDHVFASALLEPTYVKHHHDWRHEDLSDHSALEVWLTPQASAQS